MDISWVCRAFLERLHTFSWKTLHSQLKFIIENLIFLWNLCNVFKCEKDVNKSFEVHQLDRPLLSSKDLLEKNVWSGNSDHLNPGLVWTFTGKPRLRFTKLYYLSFLY
jgi:hypothetical protein